MAAQGNTNREIPQSLFLTVKTVEMHVSNAYRKLGVRSRHDLPDTLDAIAATSHEQPDQRRRRSASTSLPAKS
jgi:DNA-binding NarL/FixJ family response regulator